MKKSKECIYCCYISVFFIKSYLIITRKQVNEGSNSHSGEFLHKLISIWRHIGVLDSDFIRINHSVNKIISILFLLLHQKPRILIRAMPTFQNTNLHPLFKHCVHSISQGIRNFEPGNLPCFMQQSPHLLRGCYFRMYTSNVLKSPGQGSFLFEQDFKQ